MAGQWGTFKTTVALDVSVCVMADLPFAGRYRVKRRGAVLYIALEGESMLSARLAAIAAHRGVSGPLPFAWRGDCPALSNKNAAAELCAINMQYSPRTELMLSVAPFADVFANSTAQSSVNAKLLDSDKAGRLVGVCRTAKRANRRERTGAAPRHAPVLAHRRL